MLLFAKMCKYWKVLIVVLTLWICHQPPFLCRTVNKPNTSTLCGDWPLAPWVKEPILGQQCYSTLKLTAWKMSLKESPDLALTLIWVYFQTVDIWIKLPYFNSLSFPILIYVLDHNCFCLLSPLFYPWYCLLGFNKILKAAELAVCILTRRKGTTRERL